MQTEKLSDPWLFELHSKIKIQEWLRQLRYFYYKRAFGGHAGDGDEFQTAFLYTDLENLQEKISQLGLTLNTIPDDFPKPNIGQSYTVEEFKTFKNEIKEFKKLEQPGHSVIFGHQVFIWIYNHSIHISISGTLDNNRYEVTELDLKACIDLENHFDNLGFQKNIDKSLEESICCISKTRYPELYD